MGRAGEPQTRVPPCRGGSISAGPPPADPHGPVPSPRCYQRGPRRPRAALTVFGQALDHLHGRLEPGGVHRAGLRHLPVPSRPVPDRLPPPSPPRPAAAAAQPPSPGRLQHGRRGREAPGPAPPPHRPPAAAGRGARPGPALPGPAPLRRVWPQLGPAQPGPYLPAGLRRPCYAFPSPRTAPRPPGGSLGNVVRGLPAPCPALSFLLTPGMAAGSRAASRRCPRGLRRWALAEGLLPRGLFSPLFLPQVVLFFTRFFIPSSYAFTSLLVTLYEDFKRWHAPVVQH